MSMWVGPVILLAVVLVIVVIILATRLATRRRQSQQLHATFGPEYDHAVSQHGGSRSEAEADLVARREHVQSLNIRPLSQADRTRYEESWRATQARFVDEPIVATAEADRLVADLMRARGYPVRDFEQRAADISVNYPNVVSNYRAAHAISVASAQGKASTEDLRTAMIHYRALYDELLDTSTNEQPESERMEIGR